MFELAGAPRLPSSGLSRPAEALVLGLFEESPSHLRVSIRNNLLHGSVIRP
jgi:hypothetical protein